MGATKQLKFGPVQLLGVAFEGNRFKGDILPELERLKGEGTIRIIDLLFIRKDQSGAIAKLTASDLDWEEASDYGSYIGTLIGFGAAGAEGAERGSMAGAAELADGHVFDENDAFRLAQAVPVGTSIALALIEHTWALPLLDAIERAKGFEINNQWVSADTLVELGMRHAVMEEMEENE
ncbi:MAG TPA: hypothetical protein VGQ38_04510 [Gaiellaceae bacterium]|nr:hypothetical protein [Gaiellaceae bacterium]